MRKNKVYALYKMNDCLGIGTIKELCKEFKIKEKSMRFYLTPTYKKRIKGNLNRRELILID